jgi:DNA-directed RNA polymerase alpha subunit
MHPGDKVEILGEVIATTTTRSGKVRYLVEHPGGQVHVYDRDDMRLVGVSGSGERHINSIRWSTRTRNCFRSARISSLSELTAMTPEALLAIPNFGVASLKEVETKLGERGMRLSVDG